MPGRQAEMPIRIAAQVGYRPPGRGEGHPAPSKQEPNHGQRVQTCCRKGTGWGVRNEAIAAPWHIAAASTISIHEADIPGYSREEGVSITRFKVCDEPDAVFLRTLEVECEGPEYAIRVSRTYSPSGAFNRDVSL